MTSTFASTTARPRFASYTVSDVGASDAEHGHIRTLLYTENDQLLGFTNSKISQKPFETENDFTRGIAINVAELLNKHATTIKKDPLRLIRGMTPGSAMYQSGSPIISEIGNMTKTDGSTLKLIKMTDIVKYLKELVPTELLKGGGSDIALEFSNDMVGAAASAAKTLYAAPEKYGMTDGDQITLMMIGGGFGISHMRHFPANGNQPAQVEIVAAEDGNAVLDAGDLSLEQRAASVRAFVHNFKQGLAKQGISLSAEQKEALKSNGKAVTVLAEAQSIIPNLTEEQHRQAAISAINPVLDALAVVINQNSLRYHQKFVLTGTVIEGVKAFIEENTETLPSIKAELATLNTQAESDTRLKAILNNQDDVMAKIILSRVWQGHWHEDKLKEFVFGNHQASPYKIITKLSMKTNAEGGTMLKDAKRAGAGNNPNRLIFSL